MLSAGDEGAAGYLVACVLSAMLGALEALWEGDGTVSI